MDWSILVVVIPAAVLTVWLLSIEVWFIGEVWFHQYILRHHMRYSKVSVPMFDASAKGILYKCDCGKVWAR